MDRPRGQQCPTSATRTSSTMRSTCSRDKQHGKKFRLPKPTSLMLALLVAFNMAGVEAASLADNKARIVNEGEVHRVPVNSSLTLHCVVSGLGRMVLLWKKGHRVLTANTLIVKRDSRLSLRGNNLHIRDLTIHDGGEYMCEVEADEPEPLAIVHTVEILVPASLVHSETSMKTSTRIVEVRKGATASLECRANGNPVPSVKWTWNKNGNHRKPRIWLPVSESSSSQGGMVLTLTDVDRAHAGHYRCTAYNGVGSKVSRRIRLNVFYPPEVSVSNGGEVHAGEGMPVVLRCLVKANPRAEVVWYKNGRPIHKHVHDAAHVDHVAAEVEEESTLSLLRLDRVQVEDFAMYTCEARNSLARESVDILLTGRPERPHFDGPRARHVGRRSWRLTWMTRSFANITEYRLLYRRVFLLSNKERKDDVDELDMEVVEAGAWTNVQLAASRSGQLQLANQVMRHTLQLQENQRFEAQVQARNKFGWSPRSNSIIFLTNITQPRASEEERDEHRSSSSLEQKVVVTATLAPNSEVSEQQEQMPTLFASSSSMLILDKLNGLILIIVCMAF